MPKDFRANLQSAYIPHDPVDQEVGGPTCTRQEFSEECDVNALMARYEKVGGQLPPVNGLEPRYLDLTALPSNLQETMSIMMEADEAFMRLPALVRAQFENDAMSFVGFAQNPDNLEKMREWGLAPPAAPVQAPMKVEVVNTPAEQAGGSRPSSAG